MVSTKKTTTATERFVTRRLIERTRVITVI